MKKNPVFWKKLFSPLIALDQKLDNSLSFFMKHYGKTRYMLAMSKKLQVLGIEELFLRAPKAFVYFFIFYLIRDTLLYIVIPIYVARMTTGN